LRSDTGFTLVELVVGTAIGALAIVITTAVFAPQLRMHQRLGGQMRLQERWSRVKFLLNTEIAEAHRVESISNGLRLIFCEPLAYNNASFNPCSDRLGGGSATGSPGYDVDICYELVSDTETGITQLQRRGPMVNRYGELIPGGKIQSCGDFQPQVVTTGVEKFVPVVPTITGQPVKYLLYFSDPLNPNGSLASSANCSFSVHPDDRPVGCKESTASPRPRKY
jgi:prepilin-type N-terminal cleavage/methylation domain-containing protein